MAYTPETKWNADDTKIQLLMEIERNLEESFLNKSADDIFDYLGSYRRQSFPKFILGVQKRFNEAFVKLENAYIEYKNDKTPQGFNKFYTLAESFYLDVSQKIKESGIYYREGKDARHAVLER
jgi:hypothetical protein